MTGTGGEIVTVTIIEVCELTNFLYKFSMLFLRLNQFLEKSTGKKIFLEGNHGFGSLFCFRLLCLYIKT